MSMAVTYVLSYIPFPIMASGVASKAAKEYDFKTIMLGTSVSICFYMMSSIFNPLFTMILKEDFKNELVKLFQRLRNVGARGNVEMTESKPTD